MREIKFRQPIYSLKGEFKTFHYWGYIDDAFVSPAGFLNIKQKNNAKNKQQDQFTGLKDKKGKDIYEGDIVTGEYANLNVDYSEHSVVEWGETSDSDGWSCGATIGWVTSNGSSLLDLVGYGGCEVIGNIHETPDLI